MARLSDKEKEAIRSDLRETHGTSNGSLRKIAERHGVGMTSVRVLRDELGLEPTRARTKNATDAKIADMAAQRAEISAMLLNEAREAVLDMRRPAVIYNFGGKDNTYNEKAVERPPFGDRRQLATTAAILLDKHRMLDQYDAQQGLASVVDDWLGDMLGRRGQEGDTTA